jgi:hypothetical protein
MKSMGQWIYGSTFLELGTIWRRIVSFTPRTLYPRRKSLQYALERMVFGPRAGLEDVEKRKFLTLPGLELRPRLASMDV